MQDLRYIYSVARVRVLEKRLLKNAIFSNMLGADTLDRALRILIDTASYSLDNNIRDSSGINNFINLEMQKLKQLAGELFLDSFLLEAYLSLEKDLSRSYVLILKAQSDFLKDFMQKFIDLYNIKTLLRLRYRKEPQETLKAHLLEGGYIPKTELTNRFDQAITGFYHRVIRGGIMQIEKEDDFSVLERDIEDYLTNLMQPAKYMFFGPEAVFAYCLAKGNELKRLRLLLLAKINNIPNLLLQGRLTLSYVS